jgi:general nucleoside transport system permease protein
VLRQAWSLALAVSVTFVLVAGLLVALGLDPLPIFRFVLIGALGDAYNRAETLVQATPLVLLGLAISVAFSGGLWNIGAEGQLHLGAIAAVGVGLNGLGLPLPALMPAALLSGAAAGAAWGAIPAILKVGFRAQEVLVTIMLNYIALLLTTMVITGPWAHPVVPKTRNIVEAAALPILWPGTRLNGGALVALVCVPLVWLLMRHTVLGYRIRALGVNADAARLGGVPVGPTIIAAFGTSGALAGLAGAILVLGVQRSLVEGLSPGYGYTAIALALLARLRPLWILPVSILFAGLYVGGQNMQVVMNVPVALVQIMISLFLLVVLGPGWGRVRR